MGFEVKTGFLGIVTNTAELQAPPGALLRAKNVVIRRAGACEQRPGIVDYDTFTASPISAVQKLIPYKDNTLIQYTTGSADAWHDLKNDAAVQYTDPTGSTVDPQVFRQDLVGSAEARGNLYVGYEGGVLKWQGSGDFAPAGVRIQFYVGSVLLASGGTDWMADGTHVAYRVVGVKKDANGLITRSAPSGAYAIPNTSGGNRYAVVTIVHAGSNLTFDEIEVYRTRQIPISAALDEEYQLVHTFAPSGVQTTFFDFVDDVSRGVTLYTSPSREGIEGSNGQPPAAGCMALFKGSLFFGNVRRQASAVLNYSFTGRGSVAAGIGWRDVSTNRTAGSPNVTVADATGLQIGMIVVGVGIPNGTHVTNIVGTTVTLSDNATSTGTSTATYLDSIEVNGVLYAASPYIIPGMVTTNYIMNASITASGVVAYLITPPKGGVDTTLVLEGVERDTTLSIRATHGDEYDPPLPLYTDSAKDFAPEELPHAIMWSKPDEPEHVAPVNYAFVGDKNSEILALAPTRDALFIFKEDGIWRLTGFNGQWRIDPFDPTTRCVLPCSVQPLNNRIFALANKGIVVVSDEGVDIVSRTINEQLKPMIYTLTQQGLSGLGYTVANGVNSLGICAAANERDSEYMLAVGTMMSSQRSGISGVLVYNEITQSFSSWEPSTGSVDGTTNINAIAWHPREGTIIFGQYTRPTTVRALMAPGASSFAFGAPVANDGEWSRTIDSVSGSGPYEATFSSPHDLQAGDIVITSAGIFTVTVVGSTTTASFAANPGTGAAYCVRPIECLVEPRSYTQPDMVNKEWVQFAGEFSELWGARSVTAGMRSSIVVDGAYQEQPIDVALPGKSGSVPGFTAYERGAALRALVCIEAKRGYSFQGYFKWTMVYGHAALEALYVEFVENSPNRPNLGVKSA